MSQSSDPRFTLWMLLLGNFVIGTGILMPAGLINDFIAAFNITSSVAGRLMLVGGLVVGIGAPLFAAFTSRIDRRTLLTIALLIYAVGHAAAALAPQFEHQLLLRAFTVVGAAIFTPQAASTVGLLVPVEKRAGTIAFIFIGWSAASVVGIPLANELSDLFGWRFVYGTMAILCAVIALAVWASLKPKLFVTPLNFAAWKEALSTPVMWVVFLVTLCSMSGQFTMFGYIAKILKDAFGADTQMISAMFIIVGVAGVMGNSIAARIVQRFGIDRVIAAGLVSLCVGFIGVALSWGSIVPAMIAAVFWGLGSFSSNSLQQSRLVALAPHLAAATVALNTSVVYLGQATGSDVGGRLIDAGLMTHLPYVAFGFMICAVALSFLAQWLTRRRVSVS
jgi:MFS transporter, DHA1 family, inner membrane transport protein